LLLSLLVFLYCYSSVFSFSLFRFPFAFAIFFFNASATSYIYTLSLHDALPIFHPLRDLSENGVDPVKVRLGRVADEELTPARVLDRKSTRLNSSHGSISYAVFCLKKKIQFDRLDTIKNRATSVEDILKVCSTLL